MTTQPTKKTPCNFKEKTILNVQFKSSFTEDKLRDISGKNLDEMANVEGLIVKYYYVSPETKIIGAIYFFETLKLARDYLKQFFLKGTGLRFGIIPETLKMETGIINREVIGKNTQLEWNIPIMI